MSRNNRLVVWAMLAFALAGCATTPAPRFELDSARRAADEARRGAAASAVGVIEVGRADRWLRDADALIAAKRYDDARLIARRAEVAAELALAKQRAASLEAEVNIKRADNARLAREIDAGGGR